MDSTEVPVYGWQEQRAYNLATCGGGWCCHRAGKPFGLKTGLELRVCKTPGVGANRIHD
jgi:hypothetical protein